MFVVFIMLLQVHAAISVKLDIVDCGVDNQVTVAEGDVKLSKYPWLGVLYYKFWGESGDSKAVTTVALIHVEFVIGPAAAIGPMPKSNFRQKTRVLLGESWSRPGRRVRNYILHPEYGETHNTVCLVQLKDVVRVSAIRPLCPPPKILKNPEFFVIKIKDDFKILQKEAIKVMHVPGKMCKDFYVAANLYSKMMRPPHVACAVALGTNEICVWNAGAALVARDVWGRWQLLGLGVRGPGCGAPSRYLDMMTYYPWIERSLAQFEQITITKVNAHKYIVRAGSLVSPTLTGERTVTRYGSCDEEERQNIMYREVISLRTNNENYKFVTYNLTILQSVEFTCLTMELINATSTAEMYIKHTCDRKSWGAPCYRYKSTKVDIFVGLGFYESCLFEMVAYGNEVNMSLIDIQLWKWHEGEYYEDFTIHRVEYRGPTYMTEFGYEPLDMAQWIPAYDLWTTTEPNQNVVTENIPQNLPHKVFRRTTTSMTTTKPKTTYKKRKPKKKTTTTKTTTSKTTTSPRP